MTTRELWRAIMFYEYDRFDRMPVIHWRGWPETETKWKEQGFDEKNAHTFFNAVPMWTGVWTNLGLYPAFEKVVIEDAADYEIVRTGNGVVEKHWKGRSAVPHYIDFTFKSSADWPEYRKRLLPHPDRIPADLDQRIANAEASGLPVMVNTGSMMGWLRDWMGVENLCYMLYDDPECVVDYVDTMSNLVCWAIDAIVPRMKTPPDLGHGWEDICGRMGPFVSPPLFDKYIAHGYRKIRNKLEQYGTKLYSIDSDGDVRPLIRHWLEAGVNVMFPLEPGTWHATPEAARREYGKELRIVGGYNKLALERGRAAIKAEFDAHTELMKDGGFVMMPDHLITPGVPLDDYRYYLELVRNHRLR